MFQSINSKNKKLVEELQKGAGTKSKIVEETQLSVDRKNFLNRGIYYEKPLFLPSYSCPCTQKTFRASKDGKIHPGYKKWYQNSNLSHGNDSCEKFKGFSYQRLSRVSQEIMKDYQELQQRMIKFKLSNEIEEMAIYLIELHSISFMLKQQLKEIHRSSSNNLNKEEQCEFSQDRKTDLKSFSKSKNSKINSSLHILRV